MNNNISKCLAGALLLVSVVPNPARADEDDAFSLVTSATWQYQDNVLYLQDGRKPTFFGPDAPRGDHSYNASVGLNFDKAVGRQQLSANYTQSMVRYNSLSVLDYDGYNAYAQWRWVVGNDLSGQLRYGRRRNLQGFGDFRLTSPAKNLIDTETYLFDVTYRLDARWAMFGTVARDSVRNGLDIRQTNDRDVDRAEAGVRYSTRGGTTFELLGRSADGDYPNRIPGLSVNQTNSYSQKDIEARVRWQPVGHSRLAASIGQSSREHKNVPSRDYDDVYGRVSWEWQPTGLLSVNWVAQRQISAIDDLLSSYFKTTTVSVQPVWQATGKLRLNGLVQYVSRDGSGDTFYTQLSPALQAALGLNGLSTRQEDLRTYSLGATWLIQRNLSASAELRQDERNSNNEIYQYRVRSMSMSLQYIF